MAPSIPWARRRTRCAAISTRGLKLGLKAIKIVADPFWRDDLDLCARLIRSAREHVGQDIRLMVDAATAWGKAEEGLPLMPLFKEYGFDWLRRRFHLMILKATPDSRALAFPSAAATRD